MKVKKFLATWKFFGLQLCMDNHPGLCMTDGIPDKEFQIVAIYMNPDNQTAWIHIFHDSFEEVQEGMEIPCLYPTFANCKDNHPCECGHDRSICTKKKRGKK